MSETDDPIYYLSSILRQLQIFAILIEQDLRRHVHKAQDGPSIGSEILADNIAWLDCYIEKMMKKKKPTTPPTLRRSDKIRQDKI